MQVLIASLAFIAASILTVPKHGSLIFNFEAEDFLNFLYCTQSVHCTKKKLFDDESQAEIQFVDSGN